VAAAAGSGSGSGEGEAMPGNERRRKLLQVTERRFGRLESTGERWRGEFTGDRPWLVRWTAGAVVAGARRKGGRP
jgi:hypothetical protein